MLTKLVLFAVMLEAHILVDFHLQGILARMKQVDWWKNQPGYSEKYKDDWAIAMWLHAFEWTFAIMLPLSYIRGWDYTVWYHITFLVNMLIHACTDHAKANIGTISLVGDQTVHVLQILITLLIWYP